MLIFIIVVQSKEMNLSTVVNSMCILECATNFSTDIDDEQRIKCSIPSIQYWSMEKITDMTNQSRFSFYNIH
jgi:hypothetical protein